MSLRVLHAATHAHNIGDGALVAGMHRVLAEDLEVELEIDVLDVLGCKLAKQRDMLPRREARDLHRRYDLVLVGGGGMIEGGKGNYLSGINFNFHLDVLRDSKIPWVFYALGHNQFRRTFFFHRCKVRRLLALAEAGDHLFSVRNDGSEERLRRLVKRDVDVTTIPDPGLWVPPGGQPTPEVVPGRLNLLLQLAGDRPGRRFGFRRGAFLSRLASLLEDLVTRRGVHVLLCPHLLDDLPLYTELLSKLPARIKRESMTLTPVVNGAEAAPGFFDRYRRVDLVLGMRGHSVICAVGAGAPALGLGSHDKVGGFLREIGLEDWIVDLDRDRRLKKLGAAVDRLLDDLPAARNRVAGVLPGLRCQAEAFHRRIAERLGL